MFYRKTTNIIREGPENISKKYEYENLFPEIND